MNPELKAEELKLLSKDPVNTCNYIIKTLYDLRKRSDFKTVKDLINTEINYWVDVLSYLEIN